MIYKTLQHVLHYFHPEILRDYREEFGNNITGQHLPVIIIASSADQTDTTTALQTCMVKHHFTWLEFRIYSDNVNLKHI